VLPESFQAQANAASTAQLKIGVEVGSSLPDGPTRSC
jgi:hypothetical protein